jgi:multidrug efflux pump subunit AcrA (membrane-fusion protein)
MVIAKIPNLAFMQAKVYVLDKNAIDIKAGQPVEIRLEAEPTKVLPGKIKSVSGFSRTIERNNPIKYFDVQVSLEQDGLGLKPGNRVLAKIIAQDETSKLIIPLQAIFNDKGDNYVYLKQGSKFVRRSITTGKKNLHMVEVMTGLETGDEIALSNPEDS